MRHRYKSMEAALGRDQFNAAAASVVAADAPRPRGTSRRNAELFLLCLAAIPVVLLYAMYVANTGTEVTVSTLGLPLALFGAFAIAHVAIRFLAPAADPAILPIVFLCLAWASHF